MLNSEKKKHCSLAPMDGVYQRETGYGVITSEVFFKIKLIYFRHVTFRHVQCIITNYVSNWLDER